MTNMQNVASREILWNVNHPLNSVAMYGTFTIAILIGLVGILHHAEIWWSGKADKDRITSLFDRINSLTKWGLLQKGVNKESVPAVAHSLIYIGFLILLFTTTMVAIDHDLGISIYQGRFYLITTVLSDLAGLALILGCGVMAHRRYIAKTVRLHSRPNDWLLLATLVFLSVQGFLLEGLRIKVTQDPWATYSPIGFLVSRFFWFLSDRSATVLHFGIWWIHALNVFAIIAIAPYTKFFHIIASSLNLYFKGSHRPRGALKFPGDLEALMESEEEFSLGTATINDYTWKQRLDLDACTSCGRCQDVCPAYNSGKILSPKWLILDTRNHMLAVNNADRSNSKLPKAVTLLDSKLNDYLLSSSGLTKNSDGGYHANGEFRTSNQLVANATNIIGKSAEQRIAGDVLDPDVFWSCTTCGACVEVCPVGIDHVEQVVENRRNMVMMHGELPSEAQSTLRALESRGNPYGPASERTNWTTGLDVPILKEGDSVDVLYWVGCVSSFDPRKQKIARSLVQIFNAANVSFGILGNRESCTGDPARRLGDENLFQILAKQNINSIRSISFKTIVANCPHCFNTIKNEYPQIGTFGATQPEVLHHTQFIERLISTGRLPLRAGATKDITYHDPCYLGRYNDEYDAPRNTLKSASLNIIEMSESRERGKCCGAGGGHFWMDMKVGERVNVQRVEQAAQTGAQTVATGCPFCLQMIEDGVSLTDRTNQMDVRDIAEILVERLG